MKTGRQSRAGASVTGAAETGDCVNNGLPSGPARWVKDEGGGADVAAHVAVIRERRVHGVLLIHVDSRGQWVPGAPPERTPRPHNGVFCGAV
ncbi:unnamed protein product [Arctogadus glacialis]